MEPSYVAGQPFEKGTDSRYDTPNDATRSRLALQETAPEV